jgi:hypothetical protein
MHWPPGREAVSGTEETAIVSNESESFLARWSKRKAEARTDAKSDEVQEQAKASKSLPDADLEEIALEDLPPIESIDASTDLTHWLRKRVPEAWRQAALKRVWASDPAISQFVGLAENSWDWNAPDGVPGFGPLNPAANVAQLLDQVIGQMPSGDTSKAVLSAVMDNKTPAAETASADQPQPELPKEASEASSLIESTTATSEPPASEPAPLPAEPQHQGKRRRGGGALPS